LSALGELVRPVLKVNEVVGAFWKQQEGWLHAIQNQIRGTAGQQLIKCIQAQQEQAAISILNTGQAVAQFAASNPSYIGSTDSIRFHRLSCRYADQILLENQISFANREEAITKGYVPCQTCKP